MIAKRILFKHIIILLQVFFLCGCANQWYSQVAVNEVNNQDIGNFPYHPLVYHLDLSILSYQLYGQTLVWPFDPYYEEIISRKLLMGTVRDWAKTKGQEQVNNGIGLQGYRGPGSLNGFIDNPSHDPIIYRYDRLYPWSPSITNAKGSWTEYLVPKEVTAPIDDVYMSFRKPGNPLDSVVIEKINIRKDSLMPKGRNVLLAFEGGTGDKGVEEQTASQSLMGFVLVRYYANSNDYDLHIVFRGSRSGSGSRAAIQALSDNNAKGNPDWITDLGYDLIDPENGSEQITPIGAVSRGMTKCMQSILPNLLKCLDQVQIITDKTKPKRIYVTGHSLGGGLAQVFVSAILLGNKYGPNGAGKGMPHEIRNWPWEQIKLITFSAPRVGDAVWVEKLTKEGLSSQFFSSLINPYDKDALKVTDVSIIPKLTDNSSPSGLRVLIPSDPITTQKIPGGKHVGTTVYVSKPKALKAFGPPDLSAHEPINIRKSILTGLKDPRIPTTAWRYRKMTELNPNRKKSQKGKVEEYLKLKSSIINYYQDNNIYFDTLGFTTDFNIFLEMLKDD